MPEHQGYLFKLILYLHKVLLSKVEGILSCRGIKKSYNMALFGECLQLKKNKQDFSYLKDLFEYFAGYNISISRSSSFFTILLLKN